MKKGAFNKNTFKKTFIFKNEKNKSVDCFI